MSKLKLELEISNIEEAMSTGYKYTAEDLQNVELLVALLGLVLELNSTFVLMGKEKVYEIEIKHAELTEA